ncbi:MAG: CocE/NonD family hydrolase [Candidatus Lokiarchaeota archaeon]|nr:CocE/NonD family hydrolase [Candidatus Harpocratesius repetitus]
MKFSDDLQKIHFGSYLKLRNIEYHEYLEFSQYISMRDGIQIAVDVVIPQSSKSNEKFPTLLYQTRYWRNIIPRKLFKKIWRKINPKGDLIKRFFTNYGYAMVLADVRGTGASFGTKDHPFSKNEIDDSKDILDWIISQSWSNGKVGTYGNSYPGTVAELTTIHHHKALKCVFVRGNEFDSFSDIFFPGGLFPSAFFKDWGEKTRNLDLNKPNQFLMKLFTKGVKPVDSDNQRILLRKAIKEHKKNANFFTSLKKIQFREDSFGSTNLTIDDFSIHSKRNRIENSNVPIFHWGSWLDAQVSNVVIHRFLNYNIIQTGLIGCWAHGGGNPVVLSKKGKYEIGLDPLSQMGEILRFFDFYLKNMHNNGWTEQNRIIYYTIKEKKWQTTNKWPPNNCSSKRLFFGKNSRLIPKMNPNLYGNTPYNVSTKPTTGKRNRYYTQYGGGKVKYTNRDKARKYFLSFISEPIENDIKIIGYPVVKLYLTSSQPDGAIFVYLEEVSPSGDIFYITEALIRLGSCKESSPPYITPIPYHSFKREDYHQLKENEIISLHLAFIPTSIVLKKGSRIQISISGNDSQTFDEINLKNRKNQKYTIYHDKTHISYIDIPVTNDSILFS